MKILIVHNDYQVPGGETAVFKSDLQFLKAAGHKVITYTQDSKELSQYNFIKKASFFPNTIFSQVSYYEIRQLIKKERPDIAHIHNVFPLISPSAYKALFDEHIRIVQTLHNYRFLCPNGLFLTHGSICERCKLGNTLHSVPLKCYHDSYLLSLLYAVSIGLHRKMGTFNLIDRFIALTEFTKKKFIEAAFTQPEKISILGNYLPLPLPTPLFTKPQDGYIAYLGRLSDEKGISTIIKAIEPVKRIKLRIAGDGPERDNLHKMVKDRNLDHVEFIGQVTGKNKWDFLRGAACTIIASKCYENFPITLLESMAAGTPVIGSDLGGIPYVIKDHENGIIFDHNSSEVLREKICWLHESPNEARALAQRARVMVEKEYTSDVHFLKLLQIYDSLLNR